MGYDPVLKFKKSPSADVVEYQITWSRNSIVAGSGKVVKSSIGDLSGYNVKFSAHNPGVVVADGDTITATTRAVDASGFLSEPIMSTVLLPSDPPLPPENVTLTLV